jgi:hypothetical protein
LRTKIVCILVLCSVGLLIAATSRSRFPQPIKPGTVITKKANPPIIRALADPVRPFFDVSVDWSLKLDQSRRTLYGRMATVLSGVTALPKDRTNYYSGVGQVSRWTGMVNSVTTNNGINTVNVSVFAKLAAIDSATLLSDYSEQYSIDQNNVVTYLGFTDPNGWAGSTPMIIID